MLIRYQNCYASDIHALSAKLTTIRHTKDDYRVSHDYRIYAMIIVNRDYRKIIFFKTVTKHKPTLCLYRQVYSRMHCFICLACRDTVGNTVFAILSRGVSSSGN